MPRPQELPYNPKKPSSAASAILANLGTEESGDMCGFEPFELNASGAPADIVTDFTVIGLPVLSYKHIIDSLEHLPHKIFAFVPAFNINSGKFENDDFSPFPEIDLSTIGDRMFLMLGFRGNVFGIFGKTSHCVLCEVNFTKNISGEILSINFTIHDAGGFGVGIKLLRDGRVYSGLIEEFKNYFSRTFNLSDKNKIIGQVNYLEIQGRFPEQEQNPEEKKSIAARTHNYNSYDQKCTLYAFFHAYFAASSQSHLITQNFLSNREAQLICLMILELDSKQLSKMQQGLHRLTDILNEEKMAQINAEWEVIYPLIIQKPLKLKNGINFDKFQLDNLLAKLRSETNPQAQAFFKLLFIEFLRKTKAVQIRDNDEISILNIFLTIDQLSKLRRDEEFRSYPAAAAGATQEKPLLTGQRRRSVSQNSTRDNLKTPKITPYVPLVSDSTLPPALTHRQIATQKPYVPPILSRKLQEKYQAKKTLSPPIHTIHKEESTKLSPDEIDMPILTREVNQDLVFSRQEMPNVVENNDNNKQEKIKIIYPPAAAGTLPDIDNNLDPIDATEITIPAITKNNADKKITKKEILYIFLVALAVVAITAAIATILFTTNGFALPLMIGAMGLAAKLSFISVIFGGVGIISAGLATLVSNNIKKSEVVSEKDVPVADSGHTNGYQVTPHGIFVPGSLGLVGAKRAMVEGAEIPARLKAGLPPLKKGDVPLL